MAHIAKYKAPSVEARIEGNNFDIGQLEQLSTKDKQDMLFELVGFIMCERFEPQNWRKALSRLIDNPIAHAALAVGRTWLGGSRRTREPPTGSSSAR